MQSHVFEPDYRNMLDVVYNKRPKRLPLYEHIIDVPFISKAGGKELVLQGNKPVDLEDYYANMCSFWKDMTYDTFSYEASIYDVYPDHGAIMGGKLGPIQTRDDFNKYPFDELPTIFWEKYKPHFDAIRAILPRGMKAIGGCGLGVFESSEDLVGFESLCVMQYMDPELFSDLYKKIGDLYVTLWSKVIKEYSDIFVVFRMGDDLGFKSATLLAPDTYRKNLFPQYKRIIDLIHNSGKKFLLHSCGNIFEIMNDLIELGIDAKHSNEDEIAPFDKWIELYGGQIGLLGGIDVNTLCLETYDVIFKQVLEKGTSFREKANGFALGSGNSIAKYIPPDGFYAMIDAVKEIRRCEKCE